MTHSKEELADYTINRVWSWISIASKLNSRSQQPKPDLILPYGTLVENSKATIPGIGVSMRWIALLQNGDLVIGPEMIGGEDKESREQSGNETREFKSDIIWLKKALAHGTIRMEDFPRK